MTDYLEEHLERAEALLEQVRKMERSTSELSQKSGKNAQNLPEKDGESRIVTDGYKKVDGLYAAVDQTEETVDDRDGVVDNQGEEPQKPVDQNDDAVDDQKSRQPVFGAAEREEKDELSNAEKAEKSGVPLADQLEELDRAVSALTAVVPEDAPRSRFPAPLSGSRRTVGHLGMSAAPDKEWSVGSGFDVSAPSSAGTLSWAEQADRVFRRDSRRYDGGFSLY